MERMPAMSDFPNRHSTLWQKLVGLFVAWQLVFLVVSNGLVFLPLAEAEQGELTDSRGPIPGEIPDSRLDVVKVINHWFQAYAYATGQIQAWWLFAPTFPPDATFTLVTLHWNDGQSADVELHSAQEPQDPKYYFRMPGSNDRLFHYEMRLGLVGAFLDAKSLEDRATEWRDLFKERVGRQWKSMRAYLRWRTRCYLEEHPDLSMPDEITLSLRAYRTPLPGKLPPEWTPPLQQSLSRWHPAWDERQDYLPVEYYDQVHKVFSPLARKE
jgi:hypothetical protein